MFTVNNITTARARFMVPLAVAGALAAGALGLTGPAMAAPTGPSVEDTVQRLEDSGYNVIVNKTGAAPLSGCTVASVRQGQTHETVDSRGGGSLNTTLISETAYVDVAC